MTSRRTSFHRGRRVGGWSVRDGSSDCGALWLDTINYLQETPMHIENLPRTAPGEATGRRLGWDEWGVVSGFGVGRQKVGRLGRECRGLGELREAETGECWEIGRALSGRWDLGY